MTTNTRPLQGADILTIVGGSLIGVALAGGFAALLPALAAQSPAAVFGIGRTIGDVARNEANAMAFPLAGDTPAYWYMARAGGIVAYLLLFLATFWGVAMSGKVAKGAIKPTLLFGLHEFFPFLAVTFAAIHAVALLGDQYIGFGLADLLIPFSASHEPVWTGFGSVAFYLLAALIISFYVRKQIGRRTWRAFHYLAYLAFVLALIHGIMAGADSGLAAVRIMYMLTGATILFVTYYRILTSRRFA